MANNKSIKYPQNDSNIFTNAKNSDENYQPNKNTLFLLVFCQLINFSTLAAELTWWMLAIISLCLVWRSVIILDVVPKPSKLLIGLLSVAGCILLIVTSNELGLLLAMLHLLCFAYVLKSFELLKRRDFYQIVLLGLFVLSSALIFQQYLVFSFIIALLVIINLSVLIWFFAPSLTLFYLIRLSGKLVLQSVPLAMVLFIVFPKLSPFWEVPSAKSATTGLSDSVTIGDIAQLALSDELAFRVKFDNATPLHSQLYWRTIVLNKFDGKSWQGAKPNRYRNDLQFIERKNLTAQGRAIDYQVIASPSFQHWLFALDVAIVNENTSNSADIVHLADYSVYSKKPVTQTMSYSVSSYFQMPLSLTISPENKKTNLQFPEQSNPRLVAEAKKLRTLYSDDKAIIQAVLKQFNVDTYRYTLRPPRLVNNSLDQFYFDTKAGFCEYYASSFTYLMRAAGIPARLVTGYLGGEYNSQGGYYSVYQQDAHAWSEVWLEDQGWVRVDPTAAVNPERIERGFSELLLQEQSLFSNEMFSLLRYKNVAWLNAIRLQIAGIDYQWTRWVIGYTAKRQIDILTAIKAIFSLRYIAVLSTVALLLIILFIFWPKTNKNTKTNQIKWQESYQSALLFIDKKGLSKPLSMSAETFVDQVTEHHPELSICFTKLTQLFIKLNYQKLSDPERAQGILLIKKALKELKKQ